MKHEREEGEQGKWTDIFARIIAEDFTNKGIIPPLRKANRTEKQKALTIMAKAFRSSSTPKKESPQSTCSSYGLGDSGGLGELCLEMVDFGVLLPA